MPRIALSDIVGRDATAGNRLPDTLKLKLGLERLGYYEPDQRGFTPDGPTVSAINDDLDRTPPASLITGAFDAPLSAEAVASNQRTVRALQSFRGVGDLPTFAVAALRSGDPAAPAEVADLLARSKADAPEQGKRLREAFAEYLDEGDLSRLDAAARPKNGEASMTKMIADEKKAFREGLKAHEGGYANRPASVDPGGPTDQGISTEALKEFQKKYPDWNLPSDPRALSDEQRIRVLDSYYDTMKIDKWTAMPGLADAAPRLAELIYDSAVQHGSNDPGKWLQQALDEHLGTDLKIRKKDGSAAYDGNIGPVTRAAMERAIKDGKMGAVYDATLAKREAYARGLNNFAGNPGWITRFESFRRR